MPGGILAGKYGGKWLFGLGTFATAILTLLTPVAAYAGTVPFIVIRVLEGVGEGITYPALHSLIPQWIPPDERSRWVGFIFAGAQAGTVVSMPLSGWLANEVNWESVFYVFGALEP